MFFDRINRMERTKDEGRRKREGDFHHEGHEEGNRNVSRKDGKNAEGEEDYFDGIYRMGKAKDEVRRGCMVYGSLKRSS